MVDRRAEAERLLVRYDSLKATYYTMSTGKQQMEEARAAVLAAMTVPPGYKLVPVEPTPEMKAKLYGSTGTWTDVLAAPEGPK